MTVTGLTKDKDSVGILVRFHSETINKQLWLKIILSEDLEPQHFMHGLSKAQQGNPQPEDYPAIMTLVEKVMDGNHYITNDEFVELIKKL